MPLFTADGQWDKIYRCTAPGLPMAAYDGFSAFKPYLVDVGLLRRLAQLASTAWKKADPALGSIKKTDDLQLKAERAKQNPKTFPGCCARNLISGKPSKRRGGPLAQSTIRKPLPWNNSGARIVSAALTFPLP